jgi:hypothetical protein
MNSTVISATLHTHTKKNSSFFITAGKINITCFIVIFKHSDFSGKVDYVCTVHGSLDIAMKYFLLEGELTRMIFANFSNF